MYPKIRSAIFSNLLYFYEKYKFPKDCFSIPTKNSQQQPSIYDKLHEHSNLLPKLRLFGTINYGIISTTNPIVA